MLRFQTISRSFWQDFQRCSDEKALGINEIGFFLFFLLFDFVYV